MAQVGDKANLDLRRIRNIGEWAKEQGVRRIKATADGSLELEFFAEAHQAEATPMSADEMKARQEEFMNKITYLSA